MLGRIYMPWITNLANIEALQLVKDPRTRPTALKEVEPLGEDHSKNRGDKEQGWVLGQDIAIDCIELAAGPVGSDPMDILNLSENIYVSQVSPGACGTFLRPRPIEVHTEKKRVLKLDIMHESDQRVSGGNTMEELWQSSNKIPAKSMSIKWSVNIIPGSKSKYEAAVVHKIVEGGSAAQIKGQYRSEAVSRMVVQLGAIKHRLFEMRGKGDSGRRQIPPGDLQMKGLARAEFLNSRKFEKLT
ncbi:hypothetical protein FB451DRAFT_1186894 [Mycena latifolia]|nr:hypothetical protein FB451DRAFT_1186894 [Mycena latifolia]